MARKKEPRRPKPEILAELRMRAPALEKLVQDAKKSGKRYRTLFESANDAIFIMKGGRFVECNHKTLKLFGCRSDKEILGRTPWDFSPSAKRKIL